MIISSKRFIAKVLGIGPGSRLKAFFDEKKEREEKERILRLALLSGSIRRIK